MKLRDFVANSLPRVRGKKKKQQQHQHLPQKQSPKPVNHDGYDSNCNKFPLLDTSGSWSVSPALTDLLAVNGSFEHSLYHGLKPACVDAVIGTLNISVDSATPDSGCSCCKNLLSYCTDEDCDRSFSCASDSEKQFNTVPKKRSRIRTNPWLPSPRTQTSAHSSKSASPSSSNQTTPLTSPSDNNFQTFRPRGSSSAWTTSTDSLMDTDHSASSPLATDFDTASLSPDGSLDRNKWVGQLDLSKMNDLNSPRTSTCQWDTDTSNDLSPILENLEDKSKTAEHNISFEYEEALDDTLERISFKRDETCASINDLLEEDGTKEVAVQTDFECYDDSDWFNEGSSDECVEGLPCHDLTKLCLRRDCMQDSTDTGYSSLSRDGQVEIDDEFQYFKASQYEELSQMVESTLSERVNSEACFGARAKHFPESDYEHDTTLETNVDYDVPKDPGVSYVLEGCCPQSCEENSRSLSDVKKSLEDKVKLLRHDKLIVEQKIREAQEEERIRKEQKLLFQRQLNLYRKQILLKTLKDLKERLDNQGNRLQASYSTVLNMQQRFAQRRSPHVLLAASP